jgi:hypothetical protein
LSHRDGRRAEVFQKEPPQMARTDTKSFGQRVNSSLFHGSF